MDSDNDWTASGLFSPSKARAHQAQAKDWAFVDSWLTKKSASKRVPTFERNEDTLQALLTLATLNDAADEQRSAIDRVEKSVLTALGKKTEGSPHGLHELLMNHLDDPADLERLAELSVLVGASESSALASGGALVDLQDMQFHASEQIRRAEIQLKALGAEQERLAALLTSLKSEEFQAPDTADQTAEWTRTSRHLRTKIGEYDERLATTRPNAKEGITFETVTKHAVELQEQQDQLARLEQELKAYQSLPSDAKGARAKLEAAREDLRELVKERDALFEDLAGT